MKTILEPSAWVGALARYRGSTAQLWLFQVSLKRLLIRLPVPDSSEDLYISGIACERIAGPFAWRNAAIIVTQSETITTVADLAVGFVLTCNGIALALVTADEPMDTLWE